jgi:hypothetical protein
MGRIYPMAVDTVGIPGPIVILDTGYGCGVILHFV